MRRIPTILLLLLLFSASLLWAAPWKLALLGEPRELLDLLSVELSADASFELFAREDIEKVLSEHQLNTGDTPQLLRFFPHADFLLLFSCSWDRKSGRMLVFNARNGFRLADHSWAEEEKDTLIAFLAKIIRDSAEKVQDKKTLCLAIKQIRKIAIDGQQSLALQSWIRHFEQALTQHPEIQLLEREGLAAVLEERELSRQRFTLTPSTRLLTLEFETAARVDIIAVKLYCQDLGDRELQRLTHPDILAKPQEAIHSLITELRAVLAELPCTAPIVVAAQQEAEEFYASYRQTSNTQEALKRIRAAVALEPHNETYRYAELLALSDIASFPNNLYRLEHARQTLPLIRRFQEEFPNSQQPFFPERALNSWRQLAFHFECQINEHRLRYQEEKIPPLQKALRELDAFYAEIRPAVQQDFRRQAQCAFDFSDGLNSEEEQRQFVNYFQLVFNRYPLYVKREQWIEEFFAAHLEFLRCLELEYRRQSAPANTFPPEQLNWQLFLRDPLDRQAIGNFLQQDKSYIAFLESSALPFGKTLALELRVVQRLLAGRPYRDKVKKIYLDYFAALLDLSPDCFVNLRSWKEKLSFSTFSILNRECYSLPPDYAYTCLEEFLGGIHYTAEERLGNAARSTGEDKHILSLLEVTEELLAFNERYLKEYKIANAFRDLSFVLWEKKQPGLPDQLNFLNLTKSQEQLLRSLNRNFDFRYGRFEAVLASSKPLVCKGACRDGDGVLLLLGRLGMRQGARLARVSADGSMSILLEELSFASPAWFGDVAEHGSFGFGLRCDQDHILVLLESRMFVIRRAFGVVESSFSIPYGNECGFALLDKRLFILSRNALHSMNLQGEERLLHFSQERLEKQHELDQGGEASDLIAGANGILFFLVSHSLPKSSYAKAEIWQYDSQAETLRRCLELPGGKRYALSSDKSAILVLAVDRRQSSIYQLDVGKGSLQLLAQPPAKDKFRAARYHRNASDANGPLPYPFALQDGLLWTGGLNPACINIARPQQSPLLWLPETTQLFALDKDILFLRHNFWFLLRCLESSRENSPGEQ